MDWWQNILPLQGKQSIDDIILNRKIPVSKKVDAPDPEKKDAVMLIRNRISRIFFLRSFFDYLISLKWNTFKNLGVGAIRSEAVLVGYYTGQSKAHDNKTDHNRFFLTLFHIKISK